MFIILFTALIAFSCLGTVVTKKVVCFHTHDVNERGVDVATYDYADYTETILGYTSKILIPDSPNCREGLGLPKYVARFGNNTIFYKGDLEELGGTMRILPGKSLPSEAKKFGCDMLYILKSGEKGSYPRYPDAFDHKVMPACVHAVFSWQEHDKNIPYAGISPDVTKNVAGRAVVPHMARPPSKDYDSFKGMRAELNISSTALVVCRHGGMGSFNVPFVYPAIYSLLDKHPDKSKLVFLFLGTAKFNKKVNRPEEHPQIIYLPTNSDLIYKDQFIKTCDVMLHARTVGESFGLAVAEFSVRNKPVMTYPGTSQEHIRILGDKGFVYHNARELSAHVEKFLEKGVDSSRDYNAYKEFTPEIVIEKFKTVFIDPLLGKK